MTQKRLLTGGLVIAVLSTVLIPALVLAAPDPAPLQQSGNLLQNGGFEGLTCSPSSPPGWCYDNWTRDTHTGAVHENIFTPQGWTTYWRMGGDYGQPECKVIPFADPFIGPPARVYEGKYAVMYFNFFRMQDGGYYQTVTGLQAGATVQLQAAAHGWSCDDNEHGGYSCGDPWSQSFMVGIDPNGGRDPWSGGVIWSSPQLSPDTFRIIGPISAQVGAGGSVTVFLRSTSKWALEHLDAYWDAASLVYTSPGAAPSNTPPPAPPTNTPGPSPTAGPTNTPRPTPTPRPDGAVVYIVKSGDTLYGIALEFGVDPEQIRRLNNMGEDNMIWVDQELVISIPSGTQATPASQPATPQPQATTALTTTSSAGTPVAAATETRICVSAFHDRNNDTTRDPASEELLPNALIVVNDSSGAIVGTYTSDGVSEPYCFTGLPQGAYRIVQTPPPGYLTSGSGEWNVALGSGGDWDFQFGNRRSDSSAATEAAPETALPSEPDPGSTGDAQPSDTEDDSEETGSSTSTLTKVLSTVAKVGGIAVLVMAIVLGVVFVVLRRRQF